MTINHSLVFQNNLRKNKNLITLWVFSIVLTILKILMSESGGCDVENIL